MGVNSYIGNGPNFKVKSICEEAGIKMPSFFGYVVGRIAKNAKAVCRLSGRDLLFFWW